MVAIPRFIANKATKEVHDREKETPQCQIDEITDEETFDSLDEARAAGYDFCAWCLKSEH